MTHCVMLSSVCFLSLDFFIYQSRCQHGLINQLDSYLAVSADLLTKHLSVSLVMQHLYIRTEQNLIVKVNKYLKQTQLKYQSAIFINHQNCLTPPPLR